MLKMVYLHLGFFAKWINYVYSLFPRWIKLRAGPAPCQSTKKDMAKTQKSRKQAQVPAEKQQSRKIIRKKPDAHPNSQKKLRFGQGDDKIGGNGQMPRSASAFTSALRETMRLHGELPTGYIVDEETTESLLETLLREFTRKFISVHDITADKEWPCELAKTT